MKHLLCSLALFYYSQCALCHVITPAPPLSTPFPRLRVSKRHGIAKLRGQRRKAEEYRTDCDGQGILTCPAGTCYTGLDGFIGCCSVTSCAARTTCYNYWENLTTKCDVNTGGCTACSKEMPWCVTFTNALEDQYALYCGTKAANITTSYTNLMMNVGSTATAEPQHTSTVRSTSIASTSGTQSRDTTITATSKPSGTSVASSGINESTNNSGLSTSALAGIAAASTIVGLTLLTLFAWFCLRPRLKKRAARSSGAEQPATQPEPHEVTTSDKHLGVSEMDPDSVKYEADSTPAPSYHTLAYARRQGVSELDSQTIKSPATQFSSPSAGSNTDSPMPESLVPPPSLARNNLQAQSARDPGSTVRYVPNSPNFSSLQGGLMISAASWTGGQEPAIAELEATERPRRELQ